VRPGVSARKILLGIEGRREDEMAVATLCEAFDFRDTVLRIVNVLTVPMTAPLDVPMPEVEAEAARMLGAIAKIAGELGVSRVETAGLRGRMVSEALMEEARRIDAAAIIVRLRSHHPPLEHRVISPTVSALLAAAPCPVIALHIPHRRRTG